MPMFDDFIFRAFAAGIGLALITGPLGCFIVWRRLSYFGDTIAHSALLGVVIAYALNFNLIISVFAVSCFIALSLLFLQRKTSLPDDALLGLLAHSVLAIGLVLLGILSFIRIDLMGLLFGDILSVNVTDLMFVWIGGSIVLVVLILIWRPLFAGTVNLELAKAEGLNPDLGRGSDRLWSSSHARSGDASMPCRAVWATRCGVRPFKQARLDPRAAPQLGGSRT